MDNIDYEKTQAFLCQIMFYDIETSENEEETKIKNVCDEFAIIDLNGYKVVYKHDKDLAHGSYGKIINYKLASRHNDMPKDLCVKVGGDPVILNDEAEVHRAASRADSSSINVGYPFFVSCTMDGLVEKATIILIPRMVGDLGQFCSSFKPSVSYHHYSIAVYSVINIVYACIVLRDVNYYYTDLKLSNCLYDWNGKLLRVYLGDLGGAFSCRLRSGAIATYPRPSSNTCSVDGVFNVSPKEMDVVYGCVVLFIAMIIRKDISCLLYERGNHQIREAAVQSIISLKITSSLLSDNSITKEYFTSVLKTIDKLSASIPPAQIQTVKRIMSLALNDGADLDDLFLQLTDAYVNLDRSTTYPLSDEITDYLKQIV